MLKTNTSILKYYYEMQGKVIFPEPKEGNNNIGLAVSVAANFISIGFPFTTEQLHVLAKADKEDIINFYEENYKMLSEVIGANKNPTPFYPDFPEGCMNRNDADYFIDQLIYGLSGLLIEPSLYIKEKERFPFIGTPMRRILIPGSLEDLQNTFELAVNSSIAYSKEQRNFIKEICFKNPECLVTLSENHKTKNRENSMTCAMLLEEFLQNDFETLKFMKNPVDVLRYAAFKSCQREMPERDPYMAIALRDDSNTMPRFTLGRKERHFVMDMLANLSKNDAYYLANQMKGHDVEWNKLFKKLHISDKAWDVPKYEKVKQAIVIIQSGTKLDRPARRIEEAIKANDIDTALNECSKIPGEFMRRFDKLYRMGIELNKEDEVLKVMGKVASKAGIATITGLIGSVETRNKYETERYFKDKNGKVTVVKNKNRKAFTENQIKDAVNVAMKGMSEKFEGKTPMGNVFMSETLNEVRIPTDIRDNSGAVGSLTAGSKMPIPEDWTMLRFFTMWTNMKDSNRTRARIDIDLSVTFFDKNFNIVSFCGWNGSKVGDGYIYSGDVQDGGPATGEGRAEYVDVHLETLKKLGVVYMIPQINVYTGQKFSTHPATTFGVMSRNDNDMGKVFEPSTVVNRFVFETEATQGTPYMIDIKNREILWLNEKAQETVALKGLLGMLNQINKAQKCTTMALSKLIEANVMANGSFTRNPQKADIIFVRDNDEMKEICDEFSISDLNKFILSNNMEYITGYLMS